MMWQRADCEKERVDAPGPRGRLIMGDALSLDLSEYYEKVQCIYLDPPYYTGDRFVYRMRIGEDGWQTGKRSIELPAYDDFSQSGRESYLTFLRGMIHLSRKLLTPSGSFFLHVDWRAAAYARLLCDDIFGEEQFRNEIIWSYQTGGRSVRHFSRKHDNILFYAKSKEHFFDITKVPVSKKNERSNHLKRHVDAKGRSYRSITTGGKTYIYYDDEPSYPDDVWTDLSHMQQKDPQRTGYATQKPVSLLDRIILSTTLPGDLVADLCCGSGTTLVSAAKNGRRFLGVDMGKSAFSASRKRLAENAVTCFAPYSSLPLMLDAAVDPGIGYYDVKLNAYTLPADMMRRLEAVRAEGLELVDQWYAGLITGGEFLVYASSVRQKQTPQLSTRLQIPLLRGTVAILVIDVLGNRSLWTAARGI